MTKMRRRLPIFALNVTLVCVMLLHSAGIAPLPALDRFENFLYDIRINLTLPGGVDDRIVIVDIDEQSLREEGHWPWSREKLARLTHGLFERYGVAVLGYDVVFAERDESRELADLRKLAEGQGRTEFTIELDELAPELNRDRIFSNAISGWPVVLGYYFNINPERDRSSGALPASLGFDENVKSALFPPAASSYGGNISILQESAAAGGFFSNPLIGEDGVVRRVPTLHEYQGSFYDSFAIAVARVYLDVDIEPALADTDSSARYPRLEGLYVGPFKVPIGVNGGALVPYRGPSGSFRYISASDVLRDRVADPEILKDSIALVGTTSLGLVDLRATPVQAVFPGVEIHANIVAGVIDESFRHRPAWVWGAEFFMLLVIGLVMIAFSPFLGPLRLWLFGLMIIGMVTGVNLYLWSEEMLVMPLANSIVLIATLYVTDTMYGYFTEAKEKRQVRNAFNHYLAPSLVKQIADDPKTLRVSGETREMTFLFSDIAGFTTFTEAADPRVLVATLNEYLDRMCQIVMSHGGTVDKLVGDAVHAIFNAPVDQIDHPARAVDCAVEMNQFGIRFMEDKRIQGLEFGITRIGVNTGYAVVGNFGGSSRFDYTAHGDSINTAARMESVNKHLGTMVCISGTTVSGCPKHFFRPIGSLILKGKTGSTEAYEPLTRDEHDSERVRNYINAYEHLKDKHPDSEHLFGQLKAAYPEDPVIDLHYNRIKTGKFSIDIFFTEK